MIDMYWQTGYSRGPGSTRAGPTGAGTGGLLVAGQSAVALQGELRRAPPLPTHCMGLGMRVGGNAGTSPSRQAVALHETCILNS